VGVEVMNPYLDPRIVSYAEQFFSQYFADNAPRVLALGINPGRLGAGSTGISFTDPVVLADVCGIPNHLPRRREPSSIFIYTFIKRMGGPAAFFSKFFLTAACPLGFTRSGKNINFYDDADLERSVTPLIRKSIERQIEIGGRRDRAIVIGSGKNLTFLNRLNNDRGYFERIDVVDHPRFIMQYRHRRMEEYLTRYVDTFSATAR
jgi:hypothetical protein